MMVDARRKRCALHEEERRTVLRGESERWRNFKLDVDADGIALVTWDMPGRSMNVIDHP